MDGQKIEENDYILCCPINDVYDIRLIDWLHFKIQKKLIILAIQIAVNWGNYSGHNCASL